MPKALSCLCLILVIGWSRDEAAKPERSSHWPAVRAWHLKQNPTCAACGTKEFPQVHHIKPFHLFPALELDPCNLITLCEKPGRKCHFVFGHLYDFEHGYNLHVRKDAARHLRRVKEAAQRNKE